MDPETVRSQRFLLVRRGYDPEAVLSFLDEVADALDDAGSSDESPGEGSGSAVEVADAQRLVDEARTRAATHRLRAQRDIEALERTARSRRARLVAEIEELATARDQLSEDLDRAVDVVDRVVQWVRRTDPAASPAGPVADVAAATDDPDRTGAEAPEALDRDESTEATTPAEGTSVDADSEDAGDAALDDVVDAEAREDAQDVAAEDREDAQDVAAEDGPPDVAHADPVADATVTGVVEDPTEPDAAEPDPTEPEVDVTEPDADVTESDAGTTADVADATPVLDDPDPGEAEPTPTDPATAAVRAALRDVQDEVLGNLRDRPRAGVEEWVPASATLLALDDAATAAAARAFHDGWATAGGDEPAGDEPAGDGPTDDAPTPPPAAAREALEEVRGAGSLPGLGIADDLRVAIRASLQRGVDAGDATPQLVERLAEVHRDARQTRLDPALHDVLGQARHHGMVRRWAHDGVEAVRWVLGEERRCPGRRCRANATDGVVEPGQPFAWGEVVPPAHPGCTCTLEPDGAPSAD